MGKKTSLVAYGMFMVGVVVWQAFAINASYQSAGKPVTVQLIHGPYSVLDFPSRKPFTKAVILFGSGDGGWSGFEEEICLNLQDHGYEMLGIDSYAYAKADYDLATLQADTNTIAQAARASKGPSPAPVILGGWSMGAAQAIAAAGGPNPPRHLAGLLLVDPCGRGRYGLRLSDRVDLLPMGPGTFSMREFEGTLGNIHVVQWHAAQDSIDSRAWLAHLTAPHREYDFPQCGHYYEYNRGGFLQQLAASVPWITERDTGGISTAGSKR